jgi:L,D-peptidoglycan transpeptidase YkuD (ErfK/YbiS/YcfS/YnhG family)
MRRPRFVAAFAFLFASVASASAQSARGTRGSAPVPSSSRQLVLVVTPTWDTTSGTLRRYVRASADAPWRRVGSVVPVVVGASGLAWGADSLGKAADPHKREGDGRSPAGVFPLDSAFGFAPASAMSRVRLPYLPLLAGTECVDDTASTHYNTVVDRGRVPRVDWTSSEHMRRIAQYQVGVAVGYNTGPVTRGRGSCIFLHIWDGPASSTAGCTAFPRADVEALLGWLDPGKRPMLVQLPAAEYTKLRKSWALP